MDNKLRITAIIATVIGILDAAYLTWSKLFEREVFCNGSSQCETVKNSPYAEIGGIPIALIGLLAYLVILAVLYLESKRGFWQSNGNLLVFGMSLAGLIYSAYLTYIEVAVLHAICFYCVISAIVMLVLFIVATVRLVMGQNEMTPTRNRGG